ncbi:MAG: ThiF family adenylyltransferase [Myxococcales bacterium]|nr:ThiF family adenylyltransferase [Myxococcales bacterium]
MSEAPRQLRDARVLLVGAGGLGSPAALVLARSGVGAITVLDDDRVEATNLHRQTLFTDADVGGLKAEAAAERLEREADTCGHALRATPVIERFLPDTAADLLERHDLVVEGSDNYATKFLTADAAMIHGVPCVSAGAVRWSGWTLASVPRASACLRCVFEDIPRGRVATCATAGVAGPVLGVVGALEAALALRLLTRHERAPAAAAGELWSYDALRGTLRAHRIAPRKGCPLCAGEIRDLHVGRYTAEDAA